MSRVDRRKLPRKPRSASECCPERIGTVYGTSQEQAPDLALEAGDNVDAGLTEQRLVPHLREGARSDEKRTSIR